VIEAASVIYTTTPRLALGEKAPERGITATRMYPSAGINAAAVAAAAARHPVSTRLSTTTSRRVVDKLRNRSCVQLLNAECV
jgi:hypothetical protein